MKFPTLHVCAHRPCQTVFEVTRPHHVFCSEECRMQNFIAESIKGRRTRFTGVRHPSRDGHGARIYVLPGDSQADVLAKARAKGWPG